MYFIINTLPPSPVINRKSFSPPYLGLISLSQPCFSSSEINWVDNYPSTSPNLIVIHIKVHQFPLHFDPNITSLVWGFTEGIRSQFIEPPDSRLPSLKLQPPSDIFQPFLAQPTSLIVSCKRNVNMTNFCTKPISLTNLSSQISLPLLKDVKFSSVAWYARNLFPSPVAPLELCTLALTIPHQSINRACPHAAFSTR